MSDVQISARLYFLFNNNHGTLLCLSINSTRSNAQSANFQSGRLLCQLASVCRFIVLTALATLNYQREFLTYYRIMAQWKKKFSEFFMLNVVQLFSNQDKSINYSIIGLSMTYHRCVTFNFVLDN